MRTFDRATYLQAEREWDRGEFSWEWMRYRRIAAERGFIYPPIGTRFDDREADQPSQRAIIWRAITDNPTRLETIVRRSSSWGQVVDGIIGLESRLRAEADERTKDDGWERRDEANHRGAVMSIAQIFARIEESR